MADDLDEQVPPLPEEPQPLYTTWWFILIVVVTAVFLLGMIGYAVYEFEIRDRTD